MATSDNLHRDIKWCPVKGKVRVAITVKQLASPISHAARYVHTNVQVNMSLQHRRTRTHAQKFTPNFIEICNEVMGTRYMYQSQRDG